MLTQGIHTGDDFIPEIPGHFFSAGRANVLKSGFQLFTADKQGIGSFALAQVHVTAVRDVVVWIVAESRVKRI